MPTIIAIANQKGGVAKTTTAAAMAAGLKKRGYKVLAIDLDSQGNLSDSAGADNENSSTIYNLLKNQVQAEEAIQKLDMFDIIPANILLAGADLEFTMTGKEYLLKERLSPIESNYDYIILDTPPHLGIMTINAFTYANEVLIPTNAGIFAATGITQLYNSIGTVIRYCNNSLKIRGILLTRYNPRAIINQDVRELTKTISEFIKAPIFDTYIRSSVVVEEAQANKKDIFKYNGSSTVAQDYDAFITEYLGGTGK